MKQTFVIAMALVVTTWVFNGKRHDGSLYQWPEQLSHEDCTKMREQPDNQMARVWCKGPKGEIEPPGSDR